MPSFQDGVELDLGELWRFDGGCGLNLLEERGGLPRHQAVQCGLVRSVRFVVDRGVARHPDRSLGLPTNGLHAMLPRWRPRTVSGSVLRLNRPEGRHLVDAHRCGNTFGGLGAYATGRFGATSSR